MISIDELRHLASLAKLNLSDEELQKLAPQLSNILDFVSMLDEVNTQKIAETNQTNGVKNVLRSDEIVLNEVEEELLNCTPHKIKENSIVVPRVL